MRVSLSWLRDYVQIPETITAEAIAEKLTFAGLEVESVEVQGKGLERVFVGRILEKVQHPNADRLSLTKISVGTALTPNAEPLSIVCGAQNIAVGQMIPVATIGAVIPNGLEIKPSKIRGEASEGMLCSPAELMIEHPDAEKGILILPEDAPLGTPLAKFLGRDDTVFDISITPDRGDALSHIGVARDIAALFELELKVPAVTLAATEDSIAITVDSRIPEHCPVYFARQVEGVKVGPSPEWLRSRLESVGIRSINNVVDVSAFVMLEIGQPIHTFDANSLVEKNKLRITIRDAKEKELFSTISHREIELSGNDILIAAGEGAQIPAALAGVMGSDKTEVSEATRNVLIESAIFDAGRVRASNRNYGLLTDAAHRFERGVDPARVAWACDRTAQLLVKVAGGSIGALVANKEAEKFLKKEAKIVVLPMARLQQLLGNAPSLEETKKILERLGFVCKQEAAGILRCTVPTWRNDISLPEDIIEEVVRMWGFDKIESHLPERIVKNKSAVTQEIRQLRQLRQNFVGWGFNEALNYTFTNVDSELLNMQDWLQESGVPGNDMSGESLSDRLALLGDDFVRLESPLGEGFNLLRRELLPALIRCAARNVAHRQKNVRLFELRPVFRRVAPGKNSDERTETGTSENLRLAFLAGGELVAENWQSKEDKVSFYTCKGWLEQALSQLGKASSVRIRAAKDKDKIPYFMHPQQTAVVAQGSRVVGFVGAVHPYAVQQNNLRGEYFAADLDLDWALGKSERVYRYKPYGRFPQVERDFSATVKDHVTAEDIRTTVRSATKDLLKKISFFDVYRGERVPAGHVSYAFRVVLGAEDHTLADDEIQTTQTKIIEILQSELGAEIAGV